MASLSSYLLGVASTIVGSWVASKIHVYQEARISHRSEIIAQIIEPIRNALRDMYAPLADQRVTVAELKYGIKIIDHSVSAETPPSLRGTSIVVIDPRQAIEDSLSEALFQDASDHHHRALLSKWSNFRDDWTHYCYELAGWLEDIRKHIKEHSHLPPDPEYPNGHYVKYENLAVFVFERLFEIGERSLKMNENGPSRYSLYDGSVNVATGTELEIRTLIDIVDHTIIANRSTATGLRHRMNALKTEGRSLSSALSGVIAAKRLHGRCDLVSFF